MSSNDNRFLPARYGTRDPFKNDGFTEDSTAEDIPNGSIGTLPHLLEVEFLDTRFIGGNGGAFDTDVVLLDGFSRFDRYLVICLEIVGLGREYHIFCVSFWKGQKEAEVRTASRCSRPRSKYLMSSWT